MLFWNLLILRNKTSVFKIKKKTLKTTVKIVIQVTYILLPNSFEEGLIYIQWKVIYTSHTNLEMHIKHKPISSTGVISTCICIVCAKEIYSSCLFVEFNVTVGGKVKVSKLCILMVLVISVNKRCLKKMNYM